jgi:hypothetical protein
MVFLGQVQQPSGVAFVIKQLVGLYRSFRIVVLQGPSFMSYERDTWSFETLQRLCVWLAVIGLGGYSLLFLAEDPHNWR